MARLGESKVSFAEAMWFGGECPLAGFVHHPDRPTGRGVLICPPFGYEATCAYRTLRCLADRLAAGGNLVLRFDYEGTGASAGTGIKADELERWAGSVVTGLEELRRRGVARPAIVGLRLGAALAAAAAGSEHDTGPIVLWEPILSGRQVYRELRAQTATTPGGALGDGALNAFGHQVPRAVANTLRTWTPFADLRLDSEVLVVRSPCNGGSADQPDELENVRPRPTVVEVTGMPELLERSAEEALVPNAILDVICDWLAARAIPSEPGVRAADLPAPPRATDRRPVRSFDGGVVPVTEEIVRVEPLGLYGVLTGPADSAPAGPGFLFVNNGVAPASGPARAWVAFARELAADGFPSFRLDFSPIGESPARSRSYRGRANAFPRTAGREMLAAVEFLRNRGFDKVIVVGLCSGAQMAIRTAAFAGSVDGIFAINAQLSDLPDIGIGPQVRHLWGLTAWPMNKVPVWQLACRIPERVWIVLDRLWLFPAPSRFLSRATARGTRVHLVYAADAAGLRDIQARDSAATQRLIDSGQISNTIIDGLDHSMFDLAQRRHVFELLRRSSLPSRAA
jgi:predicted alpha/beta hydrolase